MTHSVSIGAMANSESNYSVSLHLFMNLNCTVGLTIVDSTSVEFKFFISCERMLHLQRVTHMDVTLQIN